MAEAGAIRRYLVTGGCGFIGSHLVQDLIDDGHEVAVLDDLSCGAPDGLDPRAELIVGSVTDIDVVSRAVRGAAGVFHLAALASVVRSTDDWIGGHQINQTGAVCIFHAASRCADRPTPVVYASSAAVYGESETDRVSEESPTRPTTAYGADKLGCELHAAVAWRAHGVPTFGLRFFNVYGRRQNPTSPYSGVISIFADRLRAGEPLTIHGDGAQTRDFLHVSDAVACLRRAMEQSVADATVCNIGTGRSVSINALASLMADLAGRPLKVCHGPARAGDVRRSVSENGRAMRTLQFQPRISLESGLRELLEASPTGELCGRG